MYQTPQNFAELVNVFIGFIALLIPVMFGLTFLFIVWKVVDAWIISGGESGKIEEGKETVFVGIIALVIMAGVWGILRILQSSIF